jgi:signal transduction histidine kinase
MVASDTPTSTTAPTAPSRAATGAVSAVVLLTLAIVTLAEFVSPRTTQGDSVAEIVLYDVSWWAIALSWLIVGALIAARQPRNPIGLILLGLTLFAALLGLGDSYFERYLEEGGSQRWFDLAAWISRSGSSWIPLVFVPLIFLPLYFPHGRLPSRRWRIVPWLGALGIVAFWFSEAFAAGPLYDYPEIENPYGIDHVLMNVPGIGSILLLVAGFASVASVVVRFRRSTGAERQQIKWLVYAACMAAALWIPAALIGGLWSEDVANAIIIAGVVGVTVAIGIAILRYRLYDIDKLINRTLVYGGLTAGVVAIYVAVVGGLSTVLHERADFWLALVATGLAAMLVQPLRSGLQRRVNRLMYGERGDSQAATPGLRGRLHEAFVPEAAEAQRARERLVAAREEERLRLRRDLHDGLGPALAGVALKVEAAENLLRSDSEAAARLLEGARSEIQRAVADVRRLVYALRPPALDELGLVGALREQAEKLGVDDDPRVEVEAPDDLNGLPAAVEVAAYRISLEAMMNAVRHADARNCVVRIAVNGDLELEVLDDGRGLPDDHRAGVGIASMRERAEELGGTCAVEAIDGQGTRVRARLPLGPA